MEALINSMLFDENRTSPKVHDDMQFANTYVWSEHSTANRHALIDRLDNIVLVVDCDEVRTFKEGVAPFNRDGKWGLLRQERN